LKRSTKDSQLKNSIKKREIKPFLKPLTKAQKKREIENLKVLSEHYAKEEEFKRFRRRRKISKNTAYKKGRQFEYRVKKHFEKLGYYVVRKYASKGAEDLIAITGVTHKEFIPNPAEVKDIRFSEVLLIQCKNLKVERKLSKKEVDNLSALAKWTGGTPLVAMNVDHKLKIEEIDQ
jgi:Holliday junction resolvase